MLSLASLFLGLKKCLLTLVYNYYVTVDMTLQFSLTVSDNLQIFGFFLLKSVSRAKNRIWTSGVNDFYPQCFVEPSSTSLRRCIIYYVFFFLLLLANCLFNSGLIVVPVRWVASCASIFSVVFW
jgi:hypothetical protein